MSVIDEVAAERRRQINQEGWSSEHDDQHVDGALASAAACYALPLACFLGWWPWDRSWWKPHGRRRDLVRAAALLVAEIERIDRAALAGTTKP